MQQLALDEIRVIKTPSFDNFVAGPNTELVTLLKTIAGGARPSACLFFWGEAGCGKSHLLAALQGSLGEDHRIAMLDNSHSLDADAQQLWFSRFIAAAGQTDAMVVASADQPPMRLKLRDDLRTRLGSGLVFQLKRLDDDDKAQALRQHAASRQIPLPEDLLKYLLRHYPRDIRSLMLMLDNLDRFGFAHKRAPSLALLRDLEKTSTPSAPIPFEPPGTVR
jgi:DnaA-homolog protein